MVAIDDPREQHQREIRGQQPSGAFSIGASVPQIVPRHQDGTEQQRDVHGDHEDDAELLQSGS